MLTINAYLRISLKKSENRRLRKNNKCPAIVCRNSTLPTVYIELNNNDLEHPNTIPHLYKNNIIQLIIHDESPVTVKIQDIQYHPFKSKIIHLDFIRV